MLRRLSSIVMLLTLFAPSAALLAAPGPVTSGTPAPLALRKAARALTFDRPAADSPWKTARVAWAPAAHRRVLWIAIGAGSGAAGGAFLGAALQSLSENSESLTPSAVLGGAVGGLGGALVAALLTRK